MSINKFLASDIQITYCPKLKISQMPIIRTAHDAYKIVYHRWDKGKLQFIEQFKVMFLNRGSRLLGIYEVSSGGISGTVADPKVIFIAALKCCATSIILVHNHPSGNLQISKPDERLTKKIRDAGKLLDIEVLDHLIITNEGYSSLAEEGML
jgi:DNA repair protein RadC